MRVITATALCMLLVGVRIEAQQQPKASTDDLYVDFAIPDVPALGLFGLNPQKVTRPGNLKEFSLALLPIAGSGTDISSGAAFSWAPVYTFAHSVDAYRGPLLRRLSVSAATTKDTKTNLVNVGAGARVVLIDRSDPVMSMEFQQRVVRVLASFDSDVERAAAFLNTEVEPVLSHVVRRLAPDPRTRNEIEAELIDVWRIDRPPAPATVAHQLALFRQAIEASARKHRLPAPSTDLIDGEVEGLARRFLVAVEGVTSLSETQQRINKGLAKLRKQFLSDHWNAAVVAVDVGHLSTSSTGAWGDLRGRQFGGSVDAGVPLGRVGGPAQLVAQVQARKGLGDAPKEKSFYSLGARALAGGPAKRVSVEGLWSKINSTDAATNGASKRFTVGGEFKVVDAFWIEVAIGGERTPAAAGTSFLSMASVKYAFKSAPRFSPIPGASEDRK